MAQQTIDIGSAPNDGTGDTLRDAGDKINDNFTELYASAAAAASQAYVDAKVAGLSWKQAVRVATTANGTLASAFENGDTVDGVTLATGDRILIKNQSSGAENGIYTVNASGAPTRATDADSGAELVNASVYVSEGTTNADTQWTCTTNATITVGSTSLAFAQLTSGGVPAGAITSSGLTMATARLLGRTTASSGAIEEIQLGTNLSMSAGVLNASAATAISPFWPSLPTAPVSSSFTMFKDGATTASMTDKARGVLLSITGAGNVDKMGCMENNTPGSTWIMTALLQPNAMLRRYTSLGLYVRDSSTGRIENFHMAVEGATASAAGPKFRDSKFTNVTTYSADNANFGTSWGRPQWMRLELNATNLIVSLSSDGETFDPFYQVAKNNWVATIDRCGVSMNANATDSGTSGQTVTALVMSYSLV